jgi:hypothetical protein
MIFRMCLDSKICLYTHKLVATLEESGANLLSHILQYDTEKRVTAEGAPGTPKVT